MSWQFGEEMDCAQVYPQNTVVKTIARMLRPTHAVDCEMRLERVRADVRRRRVDGIPLGRCSIHAPGLIEKNGLSLNQLRMCCQEIVILAIHLLPARPANCARRR